MALFIAARHGFPPAGGLDLHRDPGVPGATLAFDLLNCTALSWLYVRMHGWTSQAAPMAWLIPMHRRNLPAVPLQSTPWRCSAPAPKAALMTR
jgi:hypothetical protein